MIRWVTGFAIALSLCSCNSPVLTETQTPETISVEQSSSSSEQSTVKRETFQLYPSGIGPIQVGMTIEEAEAAGGRELYPSGAELSNPCDYVKQKEGPPELSFMVIDGEIARIDISRYIVAEPGKNTGPIEVDNKLSTSEGILIGSSEAAARKAYPTAEVTQHPYVPEGHYLTINAISSEGESLDYHLILETDGSQVTGMRGGRLPEIDWIEGCS